MSSVKYEFRYMPLIGKLSGESMLQQTETAINEIAEIVNENTAQADIINTLAQDANDNSVEALEKANEALETSSRVYTHEEVAINLDSYCESQLIYVANISSTNLPIAKKGFLEVKTDDDKTECVQLFVSDDKDVYVRSGSITAETVGDTTVYTADFEEWTSLSSPTILLQAGSGTSIPLSADLNDYNTEGTFYCSTTNVGSIAHCPVSEGEFKLIVMKFATANYGLQMLYPIGKHLYVRKYSSGAWGNWEVIVPKITSGVTNGSIAVNDTDVAVTGWNTKANLNSPVFTGAPTAPTPAISDNSTKIATTAFVKTEAGNYVPINGNVTINNNKTFSARTKYGASIDFVDLSNNTEQGRIYYISPYLRITGGTSTSDGSYLDLGDVGNNATHFRLVANDGTNQKAFYGYANGDLKWDGNDIALAKDFLPLSGGTLAGQLVINRSNGFAGGIKLVGNSQNFVLSASNSTVTKGTAPSSTQYWGIDFYGKDTNSYNQRIGLLETKLDANNIVSTSIYAYNCTTNTNTNTCKISVNVDNDGNAYTYAPTPANGDNSTKIATTAFVNTKAGDYLPLIGGNMTGVINSNTNSNVDATSATRYEETLSNGKDKNGQTLGSDFYSAYNVDVFHGFRVSNPNVTGGNWADIRVHVNADKKRYISFESHSNVTDGTSDNSNNIPTTAFIHSKYLSLAGGTITGQVKTSYHDVLVRSIDTDYLTIMGGSTFDTGASLSLNGGSKSTDAGRFQLRARTNTSTYVDLNGYADGTLTWSGLDISPQSCTESQSSQDTTLPSGTPKTVHSFTLTKGTWLLLGRAYFPSNANGYRTIWFSATDNGNAISSQARTIVNPPSGAACWTQVMAIRSISTTTTLYLVASQNSGVDLNASGGVVMFRLSNKA